MTKQQGVTMSHRKLGVALATLAATLALPAFASAHTSVYQDIGKLVPDPPPSPIDYADLDDQTRYVVANHGYTYVLRETNTLTDQGMVDYKRAPGAWRSQPGVTTTDLFNEAGTGAQAHHTCQTGALTTVAAIESWQEVSAAGKPEPFYQYVPFQKASAGLGDDPSHWIPWSRP